jgi:hypothetical protein
MKKQISVPVIAVLMAAMSDPFPALLASRATRSRSRSSTSRRGHRRRVAEHRDLFSC